MSTCFACGAGFACAMESQDGSPAESCWCMSLPPILPVPPALPRSALPAGDEKNGSKSADEDVADVAAGAQAGCYCPACLRQKLREQAARS